MAYKKVKKAEPGIWLLDNGKWLVEVRPNGIQAQKIRKTKDTKADAIRFKNQILSKASEGKSIKKNGKDTTLLSEHINQWFTLHGHTLKDGKARLSKLLLIAEGLGNPPYFQFNTDLYLKYRIQRQKSGISDNTCNHDLAYLKAVFSVLIKHGACSQNPLTNVSKLKIDEADITYLELDEIERLLSILGDSDSPDAEVITEICLSTGCRWGEAQTLRRSQVKGDNIQFSATKNGKSRLVPIDKALSKKILQRKTHIGRLFKDGYGALTTAIHKANIKLPRGQRSHVLRHSFAVHFMRARGNILDLQKILGHETLQMTLRYAQFHPDYLQDAVIKSPMAQIKNKKQSESVA